MSQGRSEGFAAIFLITLFLGLSLGLAVYAGMVEELHCTCTVCMYIHVSLVRCELVISLHLPSAELLHEEQSSHPVTTAVKAVVTISLLFSSLLSPSSELDDVDYGPW